MTFNRLLARTFLSHHETGKSLFVPGSLCQPLLLVSIPCAFSFIPALFCVFISVERGEEIRVFIILDYIRVMVSFQAIWTGICRGVPRPRPLPFFLCFCAVQVN